MAQHWDIVSSQLLGVFGCLIIQVFPYSGCGSGSGWGCLFTFLFFFLISTTCQVGHFDSHIFWYFIEILGVDYILPVDVTSFPGSSLTSSANERECKTTHPVGFSNIISIFFLDLTAQKLYTILVELLDLLALALFRHSKG